MTTINDPIRQASLFTMNGLVDPRFTQAAKPVARREKTNSWWAGMAWWMRRLSFR